MWKVLASGWAATADLGECARVGSIDLTADGIIFTTCESDARKCEGEYTPTTSQRTYMQDITPTNNT